MDFNLDLISIYFSGLWRMKPSKQKFPFLYIHIFKVKTQSSVLTGTLNLYGTC